MTPSSTLTLIHISRLEPASAILDRLSGALRQVDRMNRSNSSMQLTRAADYGVRVMIHLASPTADGRQSLSALAKVADAPESFLSKILQALVRASLIESRRGQSGGFEISQSGSNATIRTVIEAVDGPVHLNLCLVEGRPCHRKSWCPAHPVWERAQGAMFAVLDSMTIAELAGQPADCPQHSNAGSALCMPSEASP